MGNLFVTIVLAAGESRRMGRPKLFLPVGEQSMLRSTVNAALDEPLIVVTGAYAAEIEAHLADIEDIHFAHNPAWKTGMAGSIATGVALALTFDPKGFFIILADQPTIGTETLGMFADEFLRHPTEIIATQYPERLGVPAIFPARYASQLLDGKGPNGARELIAAAGERVRAIQFDDPPRDIDTPEDYADFLRGFT